MDVASGVNKGWTLDEDAFNKLLLALDEDRDLAGAKYVSIRGKLITFFRCRGCHCPDECADTTINRVTRKISEGAVVFTDEPARFFFGVARNVLREYWKQYPPGNLSPPEEDSANPVELSPPDDEESVEQRMQCLSRCLNTLSNDKRQLIIRYYQGETAEKIKNRALQAKRLGIPINTLRIQALRIRRKLKDCVTDCLEKESGHEIDLGLTPSTYRGGKK